MTRHKNQSFSLTCQAQAFPIPIFRQVLFNYFIQQLSFQKQYDCQINLDIRRRNAFLRSFVSSCLSLLLYKCNNIFHLLELFPCFTLTSRLFPTEPVGSKAPSFSSESALSSIKRNENQSFALLCQAQAFPVPIFRQVSYCWIDIMLLK